MGEYADMAIDSMLAEDEYALTSGGYDEYGEPIYSPFDGFRFPSGRVRYFKKCKYCGKLGLHWNKYEGKWRLFDYDEDEEEILHTCRLKDKLHGSV